MAEPKKDDTKKYTIIPQGNEITIREGEALPQHEPECVNLTGIITSPGDYATARSSTFEALQAHVIANYTARTILLSINESDYYGATISGKLSLLPDLESLGINQTKMYDEKTLMNKLKFFAGYFKDFTAHKTLYSKLQMFKAKVNKEFTNADDYKGQSAIEKITKIEHEIPLTFELIIPIFAGFPAKSFNVDICISARDGGISFWLESVELHELIQRETEAIFSNELSRLSNYLIIKQW